MFNNFSHYDNSDTRSINSSISSNSSTSSNSSKSSNSSISLHDNIGWSYDEFKEIINKPNKNKEITYKLTNTDYTREIKNSILIKNKIIIKIVSMFNKYFEGLGHDKKRNKHYLLKKIEEYLLFEEIEKDQDKYYTNMENFLFNYRF
jgi:hypothetical protein